MRYTYIAHMFAQYVYISTYAAHICRQTSGHVYTPHMYTYISGHMHMYTYTSGYMHMYTYTAHKSRQTSGFLAKCFAPFVYMYIYIYAYRICIHIPLGICICMGICICIHMQLICVGNPQASLPSASRPSSDSRYWYSQYFSGPHRELAKLNYA